MRKATRKRDFNEIKKHIHEESRWQVYYFNEEEEELFKEKILSLGVKEEKIEMLKAAEFYNLSNGQIKPVIMDDQQDLFKNMEQ